MRINFAPHFCFIKKENCTNTQSISRISMFYIFDEVEENIIKQWKKALQQEM